MQERVGVVVNQGKSLGGDHAGLRRALVVRGQPDPHWLEVPKSKYTPGAVSVLIDEGIDRILVASCVAANVPTILGGLQAFPKARFDDGSLHLAIVTADSPAAWAGALGRAVLDEPDASPAVTIVQGRRIEADLAAPLAWQIDGGDRSPTRRMRWEAVRAAVRVAHGPGAPVG